DGVVDAAFMDAGTSGVSSVAVHADGRVVIGGSFTAVGGRRRNYVAQLNADGTLDQAFQTDGLSRAGVSGPPYIGGPGVSALGLQCDGRLVLGGAFIVIYGYQYRVFDRYHCAGS